MKKRRRVPAGLEKLALHLEAATALALQKQCRHRGQEQRGGKAKRAKHARRPGPLPLSFHLVEQVDGRSTGPRSHIETPQIVRFPKMEGILRHPNADQS